MYANITMISVFCEGERSVRLFSGNIAVASSAAMAILRKSWVARDRFVGPRLDLVGMSSAQAWSRVRIWKISGGSAMVFLRPSH